MTTKTTTRKYRYSIFFKISACNPYLIMNGLKKHFPKCFAGVAVDLENREMCKAMLICTPRDYKRIVQRIRRRYAMPEMIRRESI